MAILLDSNIIIYSYLDGYQYLRELFIDDESNISEISRIEILGYHRLSDAERIYFEDVFSFITIVQPSQDIFNKAIEIRRLYNLKLGDSIIASTALINDLTLYTRNISDFEKIMGLKYINPIK